MNLVAEKETKKKRGFRRRVSEWAN
jgi:hypothetical protein